METIQLTPVLEFEPGRFSKQKRELPHGSGKECPQEWDQYWKESLADSGIHGLKPYCSGFWQVALAASQEQRALRIFLKSWFADIEPEEELMDQISPLPGGYVFEPEPGVMVLPQCCCDLGTIEEWQKAVAWESETEEMIWIGHPWLLVRSLGKDRLQFIRTAEYGEPEEPKIMEVHRKPLANAVSQAADQLVEFGNWLSPLVAELFPQHHQAVLEILLYGH